MSYGDSIYGAGIYGASIEEAAATQADFDPCGSGILADEILGASTSIVTGLKHDAIGIGVVLVVGSSLVEKTTTNVYDAVGSGTISVVGNSIIKTPFRVTGVGIINVIGSSIIKEPTRIIGIGTVDVLGLSLINTTYQALGIGLINVVGLSSVIKQLVDIQPNWLSTHYLCDIIGLTDLRIPIKSLQIRYNNSRLFVSVVIPAATQYVSELLGRVGDEIRITKRYNYNDGSLVDLVLASSILTNVRIDQGGNSGDTITLSAYSDITLSDINSIDLKNPTYRSQTNSGSRRYRCELDPRLRLGDTANINGDSFTVASIVHYIDPFNALTEVAE